jgi:hypothetical protein
VDAELLAKARRAGDRLTEAEHAADVARTDFHQAVRRLHLSGASLRELAAALAISHQRVHQIVESAGGARRWTVRGDLAGDLACSFCARAQRHVQTLIAGPGVFICDRCVARADAAIAAGDPDAVGPLRAVPQEADGRCSFCGKHRRRVSGLAITAGSPAHKADANVAICAECLALCGDIHAERLA